MTGTARIALVLLLGGLAAAPAVAEDLNWRPAGSASGVAAPAGAPSGFKITVGAPVPISTDAPPAPVIRASAHDAASSDGDWAPAPIIRAQAPGGVPPVPPPPPPGPGAKAFGEEPYNCGEVLGPNKAPAATGGGGFLDCIFRPTGGRKPFQSDTCFDTFIEPVTAPQIFEDPRALTEFRPSFSFQRTPSGNGSFNGGYIENLNLRGSVALTDMLSITVDEMGWIWQQPHNAPPGFEHRSGFTELDLGGKFTFLRNTGGSAIFGPSVAAAGLVFEIPIGSSKVEQDTGWLSLRPYITYGQEMFENPLGVFHFIGTAAYSVAIDRDRSDHIFLGAHFDLDVLKYHRFYPFIEVDYFLYTANGHARNINFEGANLFNFGAEHVAGHSELDLAFGMRYKFNEHISVGGAFEFNVLDARSTLNYGVIFDVIFRY